MSETEWSIDLPARLATHMTGLVILMSPDALFTEKWTGRCLNARAWAEQDLAPRSRILPALLRAGVTEFTRQNYRCRHGAPGGEARTGK